MKLSKPYSKLALVYDQMGADRHSVNMVEYTLKVLNRFKIRPKSGLDLCCGTGTAISLLLDKGFPISGLDGSAEMLAVAARKLARRRVTLYQKRLPRFRILDSKNSRKTRTFDFVTSFYDSLNYLKSARELQTAFDSVTAHLDSRGWFIFDMNTPAALRTIWGGQVYAGALDEIAWIWKNEYHHSTKTATVHTTCFWKNGRHWDRFDERHTERAYSNTAIQKMLRQAGFVVRGFYRCGTFDKPTRETTRICAVAQKRS